MPHTTITEDTPNDLENARKSQPPSKRRAFLEQLPTWREFWRNEWRDLLPMLIVTVIAVPLNASPPIGKRKFPIPLVPNASTPTANPAPILDFSYPFIGQIISVPVSACLGIFPPLVLFALAQIRLRSYPDLHASVYGLLTTLVNGTFFQVVLKSFVGGLRPYFYDACAPDLSNLAPGVGWGNVMYGSEVCTGDEKEVIKAITSWPSGHSNAAMGSAMFVSLWLNGKLKCFGDTRARYWKIWAFFFPLLIGAVLCGTLSLDQSHHWYDIGTGASIGIINAIAAYRGRYASIWDFRFNHIPLPKSTFKEIISEPQAEPEDRNHGGNSDKPEISLKQRFNWRIKKSDKAKKSRTQFVKRPQRFMYDLSKMEGVNSDASEQAVRSRQAGSSGSTSQSQPGQMHQANTSLEDSKDPSASHSTYYPVLTRRWQGSAVGAPGDASATLPSRGTIGSLGFAHSPLEYGRQDVKQREIQSPTQSSHRHANHSGETVV